MRILYVEDNMVNVSLVRRIARNDELINYIDGEETLKNFDRDNPDLVLLDIQLAGKMTGLDVVRELRKKGCRLPIIAVTAYAMVGDREKCIEAGCDDYIAKPLPIHVLLELFEKRRQELAQQPTTPPPATDTTKETAEVPKVVDPVETPKIDPIETPKIDPIETPKIDPMETPKIDPMEMPKIDPMEMPKIDPMETAKRLSILETQDIEEVSMETSPTTTSSSQPPHSAVDDGLSSPSNTADNLPNTSDAIKK